MQWRDGRERHRGACTLWRKVGLEPGAGRHEAPVQTPVAMVTARLGLPPRAMSRYVALLQLRSVLVSVACVAIKNHLNVSGLGAA